MAYLEIEDLRIEYSTEQGNLVAVDGVTLSLERGEAIGIVGESGSGKSTLGKAILGLLPRNGRIVEGEIRIDGRTISGLSEKELNEIRWADISIIKQSAMNALDPVYRIGSQFVEVLQTHTNLSKSESLDKARELLELVDIDPGRIRDYPHELSGGQRQRVIIALALVLDPSLVIADEPTTGLDVIVQDEILDILEDLQQSGGQSTIFITHDISAVTEIVDRVAVMYGGQIMEMGPLEDVFTDSAHPYTIGLKNAFPSLDSGDRELISIPGTPPELISPPEGCRFMDRCPFGTEECEMEPPLVSFSEDHLSKCHFPEKQAEFQENGRETSTWSQANE